MAHYGSSSPKRHKGFSNNVWCEKYNLGRLQVRKFLKTQDPTKKTAEHYVDHSGRKRWKGTAALKSTQKLSLHSVVSLPFLS